MLITTRVEYLVNTYAHYVRSLDRLRRDEAIAVLREELRANMEHQAQPIGHTSACKFSTERHVQPNLISGRTAFIGVRRQFLVAVEKITQCRV